MKCPNCKEKDNFEILDENHDVDYRIVATFLCNCQSEFSVNFEAKEVIMRASQVISKRKFFSDYPNETKQNVD